jgi:hypothetical protein
MSDKFPEDLKDKFDEILSNVDFDRISEDFENKSVADVMVNFINEISIVFQSKEGLIASVEAVKHFIFNLEENLILGNIVDEDIYREIKEDIKTTLEMNPSRVKEIYLTYKNSFKSKYPIEKLTESLLFYQKIRPDLIQVAQTVTYRDYTEKISELFSKTLDESEEEEFQRYIFDWLLKFGYIIEGFLVDIMRSQLKLYYLLNDIKKTDKYIMGLTFNNLLKNLEEDHTFRMYRNAIFHTSFIIEYQVNHEERKIFFPTLKTDQKEMSINELVGYYFRLIQVVQSYRYAFTYAVPLSMREDGQKQLVEMFDEWINELETIDFQPTEKEVKRD